MKRTMDLQSLYKFIILDSAVVLHHCKNFHALHRAHAKHYTTIARIEGEIDDLDAQLVNVGIQVIRFPE